MVQGIFQMSFHKMAKNNSKKVADECLWLCISSLNAEECRSWAQCGQGVDMRDLYQQEFDVTCGALKNKPANDEPLGAGRQMPCWMCGGRCELFVITTQWCYNSETDYWRGWSYGTTDRPLLLVDLTLHIVSWSWRCCFFFVLAPFQIPLE